MFSIEAGPGYIPTNNVQRGGAYFRMLLGPLDSSSAVWFSFHPLGSQVIFTGVACCGHSGFTECWLHDCASFLQVCGFLSFVRFECFLWEKKWKILNKGI